MNYFLAFITRRKSLFSEGLFDRFKGGVTTSNEHYFAYRDPFLPRMALFSRTLSRLKLYCRSLTVVPGKNLNMPESLT